MMTYTILSLVPKPLKRNETRGVAGRRRKKNTVDRLLSQSTPYRVTASCCSTIYLLITARTEAISDVTIAANIEAVKSYIYHHPFFLARYYFAGYNTTIIKSYKTRANKSILVQKISLRMKFIQKFFHRKNIRCLSIKMRILQNLSYINQNIRKIK